MNDLVNVVYVFLELTLNIASTSYVSYFVLSSFTPCYSINNFFHFGFTLSRKDTTPIVEGCSCYTCQNHTRAYINHLLNVHEMLAQILLEMYCPPLSFLSTHDIIVLIQICFQSFFMFIENYLFSEVLCLFHTVGNKVVVFGKVSSYEGDNMFVLMLQT